MKLVIDFKEKLFSEDGKLLVTPRDMRNFIGSIANEKFKDLLMWHERSPSPVIYGKPRRTSVDIYSYKDELLEEAFDDITLKLAKLGKMKIGGNTFHIAGVHHREFIFNAIQQGSYQYEVKSPLVYGACKTEFWEVSQILKDLDAHKEYIRGKMLDSIIYQVKQYYGVDIDPSEMEDFTVFFHDDFKHFVEYYNETQFFPAFKGTITTNYSLPKFLGYKSGLGYGELRIVRMKDRK